MAKAGRPQIYDDFYHQKLRENFNRWYAKNKKKKPNKEAKTK